MAGREKMGNASLDRYLLVLRNYMLGNWSQFSHEAVRLGMGGQRLKAARILSGIGMANAYEAVVRLGIPIGVAYLIGNTKLGDEKAKDLRKNPGGAIVKQTASNIPIVGDAMSSVMYDSLPITGLAGPSQMIHGVHSMVSGKKSSTKVKGALRAAGGALSVVGTPGAGPISRTIANAIE
jgi:hypothetical protein